MLGKVDEAAKRLSSNQITAEQLIESQVKQLIEAQIEQLIEAQVEQLIETQSVRTAHRC